MNLTEILQVLVLLIIVVIHLSFAIVEVSIYTRVSNARYVTTVMSHTNVRSVTECGVTCSEDSRCVAANVVIEQGNAYTCQLLSVEQTDYTRLENAAGYVYLHVDDCATFHACYHGGIKTDAGHSCACVCAAGYAGTQCETELDECSSDPCLHSGTCYDAVNSYSCTCLPGYTNENCQTDVDECHSSPCLHSGTCDDGVNGYTCSCDPSYEGTHCQTEHSYEIITWTGDGWFDDTADDIFATLIGQDGECIERLLDDPNRNDFESNHADDFVIWCGAAIGPLQGVRLRIDGTDGWAVTYVRVTSSMETVTFDCHFDLDDSGHNTCTL